jgi:RNA polymerase sigma-70 factor (ECF subfamily)
MGVSEQDRLLERARGGDREALVSLLEEMGPVVRARLSPKLRGRHQSMIDADDVMQVTYMEAVTRLERFTEGGAESFLAWLTKLAENNLTDAVRALEAAKRPNPKNRLVSSGSREESALTLVEMLGATYTTPSRAAACAEAKGFIDRALEKLPPDYARVIRLYDLAGKSPAEVAAEMGRSEGAVFMLRARAHDRLRETIGTESMFFTIAP